MFLTEKRKAKLLKLLKITRLPTLPSILNIEPGNICNLKCPLCPTGAGESGMTKGFIDFTFFKHIFDQLKNVLVSINLYSWGEPLLNKELTKIIRYIKSENSLVHVTISTNLNIHDKPLLKDLINSGIDEIIVSCDGATKENYEKYRVGGDFDLVMENLKFIVNEKSKLNIGANIIWNFIVFKHNEHEIEKARALAQSIGVNFRVGLMRTSMKDEILKPHSESVLKDKNWIPDNPQYSAYDKEKCVPKKVMTTCKKPWREIAINWDGKVFPCCAIYGDNFNFGNAKKDSIKKIWNNKIYVEARKQILNRRRKVSSICGICRDNGFMHM